MVENAKGGDIVAARELLNRIMGKPYSVADPTAVDFDTQRLQLAKDRLKLDTDRMAHEEYKWLLR